MNICSLYLPDKVHEMKKTLLLKLVFGLPLVIFVDYLLMTFLGCISCLFGFGDDYFCGTYCLLGKLLLVVSAILYGWFIFPEIREWMPTAKTVEC
jgi:hypothetical protein